MSRGKEYKKSTVSLRKKDRPVSGPFKMKEKKYKKKIVLINGLYQPLTLPMATPPTMCFERIR